MWSAETQGSHHPEHLASGTVGLFPEAPPGTVVMAPEGSGQACPVACVRRRAEVAGWEGGSASPGSSSAVLSGAWRGLSVAAPVPDGTSPSCRHPSRSPNRAASHSPHTQCPLLRTHPKHLCLWLEPQAHGWEGLSRAAPHARRSWSRGAVSSGRCPIVSTVADGSLSCSL